MAAEFDQEKQIKAHAGSYDFFIRMMMRGTIVAAIVAALVVWMIAG